MGIRHSKSCRHELSLTGFRSRFNNMNFSLLPSMTLRHCFPRWRPPAVHRLRSSFWIDRMSWPAGSDPSPRRPGALLATTCRESQTLCRWMAPGKDEHNQEGENIMVKWGIIGQRKPHMLMVANRKSEVRLEEILLHNTEAQLHDTALQYEANHYCMSRSTHQANSEHSSGGSSKQSPLDSSTKPPQEARDTRKPRKTQN